MWVKASGVLNLCPGIKMSFSDQTKVSSTGNQKHYGMEPALPCCNPERMAIFLADLREWGLAQQGRREREGIRFAAGSTMLARCRLGEAFGACLSLPMPSQGS